MHVKIPLRYIEIFGGRTAMGRRKKSYFLYTDFPTRWRENWRNISGFRLAAFGWYISFCFWKQEGVYRKSIHGGDAA